MDKFPRTFKENLILRVEYHAKCEQDNKALSLAVASFKANIALFFDLCLWTFDPRKSPSDRPFILYPYQLDYVNQINGSIESGESLLTEKTRDMGVSWMVLGVFLYRWLLFNETFLVGSRVESKVDTLGNIDSLFERLRYMIRTMPQWILDVCEYDKRNSSYMKLFKSNGSSITGESMNDKFSRQGRYKGIMLDEFAFVDRAEIIWTACGDSAPCKLPVSTPNGAHNKFARLRKSGKIKIATLHWKQHPEKSDEWYKKQCKERTDRDIAQELDINYTVSAGKPFYGGFIRGVHSKQLEINTQKELILGFDYGYHHPCCVVSQLDSKGRWIILDCLLGENELIDEFGTKVKLFLNQKYPGFPITCYGDPAGNQESDKSRKTSVMVLEELGFTVFSIPSNTSLTNYNARKKIIEGKFKQLIDGSPALLVNDIDRTQLIIEAFEGGWHYPEANKHGFVEDRPVKEGFYEHCLSGDTLVRTLDGWHKIKDLVNKDFITYAYDSLSKRLVPAYAKDCRKTQENVELWKLTMDTGELIATPDHLIMMRDGAYRQLKDLKSYDEIMPFYEKKRSKKGHTVISLNDGSIVDEHRYIYNWFNGNLREGYHVHHKDGIPSNNYPDNLEQIEAKLHMAEVYKNNKIVRTEKGNCVHDWDDVSRKKVSYWSKKYWAENRIEKKCEICGNIFMAGVRQKYCSKKCGWKAAGKRRRDGVSKKFKGINKCINCGKEFNGYAYRKFCAIACRGAYRRKQNNMQLVNHKVISVEFYGYGDTYNLEVDKYHNFPANGVIVHNCMNCIDYIAVNLFSPVRESKSEGVLVSKVTGDMKDVHWEVEDEEDSNMSRYRRVSQGVGSEI